MFDPFEKSGLVLLFVLLPGFLSLQIFTYLLPTSVDFIGN